MREILALRSIYCTIKNLENNNIRIHSPKLINSYCKLTNRQMKASVSVLIIDSIINTVFIKLLVICSFQLFYLSPGNRDMVTKEEKTTRRNGV